MKSFFIYCIIVTFCPISGVAAGFADAFASFFSCPFKECCTEKWINLNSTELALNLQNQVYGQHIAFKAVVGHTKAHFSNNDPPKALALSFHGGTGTGKSHVSKIVSNSIYRKGMESQFVHLISSTKEFPHIHMVPTYKDKLRNLIETSVKKCERSMFIFDETDKMPPGLMDTIKPYLENYDKLDGVNYRKAIFIFLSKTAGSEIARQSLNIWHEGKDRESIELKDMEEIIIRAAVNTKTSGFHNSDVFLSQITAYIPFLPLERNHVRQCIKDNLLSKNYYKNHTVINEEKVREIAEQLQYYPENEQLYSTTGCKRVPDKTDFVMMED